MQLSEESFRQLDNVLISVANAQDPELKMEILTRLCVALGGLSLSEEYSTAFQIVGLPYEPRNPKELRAYLKALYFAPYSIIPMSVYIIGVQNGIRHAATPYVGLSSWFVILVISLPHVVPPKKVRRSRKTRRPGNRR